MPVYTIGLVIFCEAFSPGLAWVLSLLLCCSGHCQKQILRMTPSPASSSFVHLGFRVYTVTVLAAKSRGVGVIRRRVFLSGSGSALAGHTSEAELRALVRTLRAV